MIRLLTHAKCPPGEFYYIQGGTVTKKFPPTPEIRSLASKVANFRRANNLPGATQDQALADIDAFTCARLNNNPRWCIDTDRPIPNEIVRSTGGCSTCGAKLR